jgi:hypothetical protein
MNFSPDERRFLGRLAVDLVGQPHLAALRVIEVRVVGDPTAVADLRKWTPRMVEPLIPAAPEEGEGVEREDAAGQAHDFARASLTRRHWPSRM